MENEEKVVPTSEPEKCGCCCGGSCSCETGDEHIFAVSKKAKIQHCIRVLDIIGGIAVLLGVAVYATAILMGLFQNGTPTSITYGNMYQFVIMGIGLIGGLLLLIGGAAHKRKLSLVSILFLIMGLAVIDVFYVFFQNGIAFTNDMILSFVLLAIPALLGIVAFFMGFSKCHKMGFSIVRFVFALIAAVSAAYLLLFSVEVGNAAWSAIMQGLISGLKLLPMICFGLVPVFVFASLALAITSLALRLVDRDGNYFDLDKYVEDYMAKACAACEVSRAPVASPVEEKKPVTKVLWVGKDK